MNWGPRFLVITASMVALAGCATTSAQRRYVVERDWVRSTLRDSQKGYAANSQMPPTLIGKFVLQGNSTDGLVAFDLNGQQIWRIDVPDGVNSGVEHAKGTIYFGGSDGQFYAADLQSGRVKWTFPTRAETLATPRFAEDTVYFLSGNNVVYALDAETGRQKWIYDRAATTSDLSIRGGTQPAVVNGLVYVGFTDGYVVSLGSKDGSVRWERLLNSNPKFRDVDSSPIVVGNQMYLASYDHALYCLNINDGQVVWRFEDGGASPVTIANDSLYFASSTGWIRSLDRRTGQVIWEKKLKKGVASQPIFQKGLLLFNESNGSLHFWNASAGEEIARYDMGWGSLTAPSTHPDTNQVFMMSNASNLYAIKAMWQTGIDKSWR